MVCISHPNIPAQNKSKSIYNKMHIKDISLEAITFFSFESVFQQHHLHIFFPAGKSYIPLKNTCFITKSHAENFREVKKSRIDLPIKIVVNNVPKITMCASPRTKKLSFLCLIVIFLIPFKYHKFLL